MQTATRTMNGEMDQARIDRGAAMDVQVRQASGVLRRRGLWRVGAMLCGVLVAAAAAWGDTIVLKDGRIIEGEIVRESSRYIRIKSQGISRSIRRKDIERIEREGDNTSLLDAMRSGRAYTKLSPLAQELKDAEALYRLGRFEEIPPLVEPLIGEGAKEDDMFIRWLLIENYERQGKWEEAEALLKKTLEDGRQEDKIRAQAHLDIFEENPGYTLRKVGGKRARHFLPWDMYLRGKRRNALQDPEMMEAALRAKLNQLVRSEEVGVVAFSEQLDQREMFELIDETIEEDDHASMVVKSLPYLDALHRAETAVYKADAILPGAARGFALDLVRKEVLHLDEVLRASLGRLEELYPRPEDAAVGADGVLTPEGREQWRERCDTFLKESRPRVELIEYILRRCSAYPSELQGMIEMWTDVLERIEQMQQSATRNRNRARI